MAENETIQTEYVSKAVWFLLIVIVSALAGMYAHWSFPGLNLYAQDLLMRSRGTLPVPDDIVIVAIDETSIKKLGRFPFSRDLTAEIIERVSEAKPKVITLNVLYSEPTDESFDERLAEVIKNAGNIVVSEQLVAEQNEMYLPDSVWLKNLPEIENAAAGIGHVNVATGQDGTARELFLQLANDDDKTRWALALETIRVGENFAGELKNNSDKFIKIGNRQIPFLPENERTQNYKLSGQSGDIKINKPKRIFIDYIGPTNSFADRTYSFADVLKGNVPTDVFQNKYVLIGATAATLGDNIATPFVHFETADGNRNGELMPGVEILANSVNTILRERFYQPVSDLTAVILTILVAFAVIFLLQFSEGNLEAVKKIGVLIGLLFLIFFGSYLAYVYFFIIPPAVPLIISFAVASPLALLYRSLQASKGIDARIGELLAAEKKLIANNQSETENSAKTNKFLPRGLDWKTQTLGNLSRDLIARSLFVDNALRSLDEGLLIADIAGNITFANRKASEILQVSEKRLVGKNLFERIDLVINKAETKSPISKENIDRLLIDKENIKSEIAIGKTDLNHYELHLSTVISVDKNKLIGIIATLADITHHRELQQTKDDIITLVTHELRTPLTAIQGMSEVLSEHEVDRESQSKMLDTINQESKRLAQMINEYLDISRLESGKQKAHFSNVNIIELLERTKFLLEPLATERNIEIFKSFADNIPLIFADSGMLLQAFTNVIGNAIKYSSPNSTIKIAAKTDNKYLKIEVSDEGAGISEEHLTNIFDKFYRVPNKNASDINGTGLGLALTKQIIELHGGRIEVESKLNIGTTFTVLLPLDS